MEKNVKILSNCVCLERTGLPKKNETSGTTVRNYYGLFLYPGRLYEIIPVCFCGLMVRCGSKLNSFLAK